MSDGVRIVARSTSHLLALTDCSLGLLTQKAFLRILSLHASIIIKFPLFTLHKYTVYAIFLRLMDIGVLHCLSRSIPPCSPRNQSPRHKERASQKHKETTTPQSLCPNLASTTPPKPRKQVCLVVHLSTYPPKPHQLNKGNPPKKERQKKPANPNKETLTPPSQPSPHPATPTPPTRSTRSRPPAGSATPSSSPACSTHPPAGDDGKKQIHSPCSAPSAGCY